MGTYKSFPRVEVKGLYTEPKRSLPRNFQTRLFINTSMINCWGKIFQKLKENLITFGPLPMLLEPLATWFC